MYDFTPRSVRKYLHKKQHKKVFVCFGTVLHASAAL